MGSNLKLPVFKSFEFVANSSNFVQIPDDWIIGLADIVNSTDLVESGGYKTVNFVGAATIGAISNALSGDLKLFGFGGDGGHFAVPPEHAGVAEKTLKSVSNWAQENFDLELRVGLVSVEQIRKSGHDVLATMVQASEAVQYAMFSGGGIEWAEKQLKSDLLRLAVNGDEPEPDLTGLSCQWGPVKSRKGVIVSLIVKPSQSTMTKQFERAMEKILALVTGFKSTNPVSPDGPPVRLPRKFLNLQAKTSPLKSGTDLRKFVAACNAIFAWVVFKFAIPLKGFNPNQYRREISENSDFRKFSDGLMMTLDCSHEELSQLNEGLNRRGKGRKYHLWCSRPGRGTDYMYCAFYPSKRPYALY